MSFQKDRRLSVSTKVPKNFARTPPPAFLFPDQRFQRPKPAKPAGLFSAGPRRRRRSRRLSFPCQAVLFKELSFLRSRSRRSGGGGYLMKADLLVNQAFRPFRRSGNQSIPGCTTVEPVSELAAARFRARGGYTEPALNPQASNDRFANYLNEPESRKRRLRPRSPALNRPLPGHKAENSSAARQPVWRRTETAPRHHTHRSPQTRGRTPAEAHTISPPIDLGKMLRQTCITQAWMRANRPQWRRSALFFHIQTQSGCVATCRAA